MRISPTSDAVAHRCQPRRLLSTGIAVLVSAVALCGLSTQPATAATPTTPVLVAPANGSTAGTATPTLSVTASDPDGGQLDVTFEGRKAGATVPVPNDEDPFSIVVLPDTQNYTYSNRQGTMVQQTQWAVNTRASLNTAMVVQLGDLVSNYDDHTQWGHVSTALQVLDDARMPNTVLPGNHDFNNATEAYVEYNQYFPPSRYASASWLPATSRYGGHMGQSQFGPDPVNRQNMNNFALFTAGGRDFLVLNVEYEAPRPVYDWADRVLDAYPDRTVIMATHSFVSLLGTRRTDVSRTNGTSPATMWNDLVSTHCSIRLVLSGHEHSGDAGENRRTDTNACGNPVHQILTDYQDRANGGDGWLRYYTFDPATNIMKATTYSPKLDRFETDADSSFSLPFEVSDTQVAPFSTIGTATVASGAVASKTWSGLEPDTLYEWRAVANDGTASTTSPVWTVRTPPAPIAVDDTFTRSLASGWGSTDTGDAWAVSTSSAFTVSAGTGRMTVPAGTSRTARLSGVSVRDTTLTTDVAVTPGPTGSGVYVSLQGRLTATSSYRAKAQFATDGALTLSITRFNGAETTLGLQRIPGLTVAPGQLVRVQLELTGASPTTIRARAWLASTAEPATWTLTATDSTAEYQAAGAVGLETYVSSAANSSATVAVDEFHARTGSVPPANRPPVAVIGTPTINQRSITVSGSGSSDPDGTITAYAWNYGDGGTGTGATDTHTYATDGTYTVRLTVTDNGGATATTTRNVTVAATPPATSAVRDDFGRSVNSGWGLADAGGGWTVQGSAAQYGVGAGVGTQSVTIPGVSTEASLRATTSTACELRTSIAWSRGPSGGTLYTSMVIRAVSTTSDYRLKVVVQANGRPLLVLGRRVGGVETVVAQALLSGPVVAPNNWYSVAVRAVPSGGSTVLSAKLWPRGTTEPAAWQITGTDATASLQSAGWAALGTYMSSSATAPLTTSFDDLRLTRITQP